MEGKHVSIRILMLLQDEKLSLSDLMSRLHVTKHSAERAVQRLKARKLIQFNQIDNVYELVKN